nr:hypothetical protein [Tanacetum cinerariifolium]
ELGAIPDHMLGAFEVQIPENNLDNLKSTRDEKDRTSEALDPQEWFQNVVPHIERQNRSLRDWPSELVLLWKYHHIRKHKHLSHRFGRLHSIGLPSKHLDDLESLDPKEMLIAIHLKFP